MLNILRPLLAVLIMFIPLYPKFPLANFTGIYVALRLDDIVIAIAVIVWFLWQVKNKFPVFKNKITFIFIAYLIAITISTIISIFIYQTTSPNILLLHFFRRIEYVSIFFITLSAIQTKKDFTAPYLFLLLSLVGIAIYGYGQRYFDFPIISTMNEEFSHGQLLHMDVWTRISSTFAGHYDLAAYLSLILILLIGVTTVVKNKFIKLISFILFLVGFNLLTQTASRVSIFAFWGGSILSIILVKKYIWTIPVSALVIYSMFTSVDLNQRLLATLSIIKPKTKPTSIIVTPTTSIPTIIVSKISPVPTITSSKPTPTIIRHGPVDEFIPVDADVGVARSGEIRFNVEWPRAIAAFNKNYLFGTGLGSISLATDNDYLRLLGESGVFGFVTFLLIPLYFIFKTIKLFWQKNPDFYVQLQLIFIGVITSALVNAIFIDIFEASKVAYTFWVLMAIFYRLIELNNSKK
ncbi:MAG: hypothetical protein WC069_02075 [Candidatus Shapirobacteria bacterium]